MRKEITRILGNNLSALKKDYEKFDVKIFIVFNSVSHPKL
mgnify:CR=1 FL=1